MKSKIEHWPLLSFKEYEKDIDPNPKYQRNSVWKPKQRNMLIDSILRQIDIPKIYLTELDSNNKYMYQIIDGKQRMSAIWDFLKDNFTLDAICEELTIGNEKYDVSECAYSELDRKVKIERIHKYSLDVVIIYDSTEDEIADLFYRLNNGTPLSPSEVRNSMPGIMGDTIRKLSKHPFFKKVSFNKGRFIYDQVAAQMMLLEISEGIADTRDRSLSKMYGDYTKSIPLKSVKSIEKVLNTLDKIFKDKSRLLNRASTINIYLLVSFLIKNIKFNSNFYDDFFKWFIETEPKRLNNNNEYKLYMSSSANSRKSIEERFKILLYDFYKKFNTSGIIELDPQRIFSEKQKIQIYNRDKGICQNCFKKVKEYSWEADHKIPWVKGGRTTVDNGQLLCKKCNLKKKDKLL
ncbi:GmrSD restriction endonuclease domain-containing protein [Clostridium tyrobutyricum]|uniref:GmrSD restriction endonuclease domain-containing protein n=1 Tax=Clostridium tyrobutyricum TaxID=1519 RepID=UPI0010A9DA11|nr:DUF262 domain-containing protein [Clostridium tyrobutyricum]QCH27616.1 HNH endonuclease [Clostridium tyrobutyricum]